MGKKFFLKQLGISVRGVNVAFVGLFLGVDLYIWCTGEYLGSMQTMFMVQNFGFPIFTLPHWSQFLEREMAQMIKIQIIYYLSRTRLFRKI